jgi:hypothetical protein
MLSGVTEGQAKSRIEAGGYSNVTELKKDDSGVWRGKGMKDGKSVTVSVDFQGNVRRKKSYDCHYYSTLR